jgi:predicted choloylglycine hydrolase
MPHRTMQIAFRAIAEDFPSAKWRSTFDRHWHAYSRWFLRDGDRARPTYLASVRALKTHMPELVPVYERLVEVAGGRDIEARFLSMWCPPTYVGGCSQAIVLGEEPWLVRNYDYSPHLLEGTWLATKLLNHRVVAMTDCLWGVLDGVNESGLAASLAFGGRTVTGRGFGIPLVLRYVLETATSVRAALAILQRLPVHMAYTVALVDRHGRHATVFVAPDRGAEVVRRLVSTNHQRRVEWPRHALATSSVERAAAIEAAMRAQPSLGEIVSTFLRPPVFQTGYQRGYGTLYTAIYRPSLAAAELVWPTARWVQTCGAFAEGTRMISFDVAPAAGGTGDILASPLPVAAKAHGEGSIKSGRYGRRTVGSIGQAQNGE